MHSNVVVNEPIFKRRDWPAYAVLTAINLGVAGYALWFWVHKQNWGQQSVAFVLLSIPFIIGVAMYESRWLTLPFMRRPRHIPASERWKVGVATTFVPGAESIEMLEDTLIALVAMDYPHETWVLDEGDDEQVKALCELLGAHHFSRKGIPRYQATSGRFRSRSKHGNYNAWLQEVGFDRYDIVVAFDPDHVPHDQFLHRVLGYFDDPGVGYVQAAQVYYNQPASFIAKGAAEETYAYYSSIQMSSYAFGYPIVTGCHNAHRVTALREIGGFAPHDADDLLMTIFYRASGWRGVYVPEKLALGITPVDWSGYLTQQRRWARSVLDVKFRIFPNIAKRLSPLERTISFMHGLYYLHGLGASLGIGLLAYMLLTGNTPTVFALSVLPPFLVLFAVLTGCNFWRQRFFLDPRNEWGIHWRAGVLHFAKWPYVLGALYDVLFRKTGMYTITAKVRTGKQRLALIPPHLLAAGVIVTAWIIGMERGVIENPALHISTVAVVLAALAVAATELFRFPPPYDSELARERLWPPDARGLTRLKPAFVPPPGAAPARRLPAHAKGASG